MPITDTTFYLVAVPTIFFIAFTKGGLGGGFSIVGVPMLSLVTSPTQAAAILAPIICFMDIFAVWAYPPRTWDTKNLRILVPGLLVGIALGITSFKLFDDGHIKLLIGFITISFALNWWLRRNSPQRRRGASLIRGSFWGMLSGFTTFVAHSGGPPLAIYLLPQGLDKTMLAGTTAFFFTIGNYVKLFGYIWLGQLNKSSWITALMMTPAVPAGIYLGRWAHNRLSNEKIYMICYLLLVPTALKLIGDGLHVW
jgi:uncharacterized membrane protein YfcA